MPNTLIYGIVEDVIDADKPITVSFDPAELLDF